MYDKIHYKLKKKKCSLAALWRMDSRGREQKWRDWLDNEEMIVSRLEMIIPWNGEVMKLS